MTRKRKPPVRITVSLPDEIASVLDKEIKRIRKKYPDVHPTRASVAVAIIRSGLLRCVDTKEDRKESYKEILREVSALKAKAKSAAESGDSPTARSCYLRAAAAELDALAVVGLNDETAIKSAVIEVLSILKSSTGYKRFPDIPDRIDTPARDS